ncbi:hypothetical protein GCM10023311_24990 [Flaviramulus aquimarinus]|uniref:SGNH/GDSL hydrolase family protein n=1 Tax=Flaviramulus aquimarinus TaxID=1170456 RepID=A0ABP9FCY1_9FLAO
MKKLFIKCTLYIFFIIIALELVVRVFHLYKDVPIRYIDAYDVEKSLPNQTGFAVTGNRRQNYSEYHINSFGFNSYRDFQPSDDKTEIALVGDSFIEGMHQNYSNSIGKKIEGLLKNVEVYEYGYAGYDLANQLYLIQAYQEHFKAIDHIIFYIKYNNDLDNSAYTPNYQRIKLLKSPLFKIRDEFKLLAYASAIGIVDPIKDMAINIIKEKPKSVSESEERDKDLKKLENFKSLINTFGFDKNKMAFLLNSKTSSPLFLEYCRENGYPIIDFALPFENSKEPPTLIYDLHWNNHGRTIIANVVADFIKAKK